MIRGLEPVAGEERLRGLLQLGGVTARRRVSLLSSEVHSERTRVNGHMLQQDKFGVGIRKRFAPKGGQTLEQEAREMEKSHTQNVAAQSPEHLI